MKTKLALLVIFATAAVAAAQKPTRMAPNTMAAPRSAPRVTSGQSTTKPQPGIGDSRRSTVPGYGQAARPSISAGRATIPSTIARGNGAIFQGHEVADGVREMGAIRKVIPGKVELILGQRRGGGNNSVPQDPLADGGFTQRDPKAPAGISRNNKGGLRDLRNVRGQGSRESEGNRTDFSHTGLRIFDDGVRMHFGQGSGFSGRTTEGYEINDNNGDATAFVDYSGSSGTGRYSVTEHHDANGQITGSTESSGTAHPGGKTIVVETERRRDGSVVGTTTRTIEERYPKDGKEGKGGSAGTADTTVGTKGGERSPTEISNGGPIDSAKDASGLAPIDLLRQRAEGAGNGTTPYTIRPSSGANRVRPVGEGQQTGIATGTNRLGVNQHGTVVNPGPAGGGDDRPD